MNAQGKGFAVSIGFHAGMFALLLGLASGPRPEGVRTLSLDITIARESVAATPSATLSRNTKPRKARPELTDPVLPAKPEEPAPVMVPEPMETAAQEAEGAEQQASISDAPAQGGQDMPGIDLSELRENVQRSIAYPALARRMGWEGRVVISFMICADGTLRNVRLEESSGKPILDRNALDVVKRIDRLPANAGIQRVVLPIVYKLDG